MGWSDRYYTRVRWLFALYVLALTAGVGIYVSGVSAGGASYQEEPLATFATDLIILLAAGSLIFIGFPISSDKKELGNHLGDSLADSWPITVLYGGLLRRRLLTVPLSILTGGLYPLYYIFARWRSVPDEVQSEESPSHEVERVPRVGR